MDGHMVKERKGIIPKKTSLARATGTWKKTIACASVTAQFVYGQSLGEDTRVSCYQNHVTKTVDRDEARTMGAKPSSEVDATQEVNAKIAAKGGEPLPPVKRDFRVSNASCALTCENMCEYPFFACMQAFVCGRESTHISRGMKLCSLASTHFYGCYAQMLASTRADFGV
jgi:hypothetical protein